MVDIKKALKVAEQASNLGSKVLLDYFGQLTKVSEKNQAGLVSEADIESEKVITRYLRKHFPDIPVLGEEESFSNQGERLAQSKKQKTLWLIDPLDGTTNYIHKLPFYCVSIGLQVDGALVLGLCEVPAMKLTYKAIRDGGAFCNNKPIRVSDRKKLKDSLLATGFSSTASARKQVDIFGSLINKVRGIRRIGSAAFDLCLVASGTFDAYWEKNLSPWDTAAGTVIVREAGGVVTSFDDDQYSPFDNSIIAGNPTIHKVLRKHISHF